MSDVSVRLLGRLGNAITDLPGANVDHIRWVLSESGEASFTIDPLSDGATQIKQWDTEIQIWFDDVLRWWGIPINFSGGSGGVTVSCEGLMSWLKKRMADRMSLLYGDASAVPPVLIDQFTIGWSLVSYAQSETYQGNRNLNFASASFSPSGIGRSQIYKRDEHKNIYDILQEFRTMYQGFEFEIVVAGDGSRLWTPYYPRKGTAHPEFHMVYSEGESRNISDFAWSSDGMNMVTHDYNTGGSVQNQKVEENYEDTEASSRHGVLQAVQSSGSQLDRNWLAAAARKQVADRKEPITDVKVTSIDTDDLTMFGVLGTGDWIPVTIDYGMIQVNDWRRVREITWNQNETLSLGLGEAVVVS